MAAEELGPRRHRDDAFVAFSWVAPLLSISLKTSIPRVQSEAELSRPAGLYRGSPRINDKSSRNRIPERRQR